MDDPIPVTLEFRAKRMGCLGMAAAPALRRKNRIRGQDILLALLLGPTIVQHIFRRLCRLQGRLDLLKIGQLFDRWRDLGVFDLTVLADDKCSAGGDTPQSGQIGQ